jgi:hypothetical protein
MNLLVHCAKYRASDGYNGYSCWNWEGQAEGMVLFLLLYRVKDMFYFRCCSGLDNME